MFDLCQTDHPIFRRAEYRALVTEVQRLGARTAIEFGPGISTVALVEAGIDDVLTLEHDDFWFAVAQDKFKHWPQIRVGRYVNQWRVTSPDVPDGARFDVAFVDSPVGQGRKRVPLSGDDGRNRANTVAFAMRLAPVILLHDALRDGEQRTLRRLSESGRIGTIDIIRTPKGLARITVNQEWRRG